MKMLDKKVFEPRASNLPAHFNDQRHNVINKN